SPHLVTIFDVRYNDRNEPFVIMEYVSGPSLHDLLLESPHGLGAQKAAFFLREIAKGLAFLHECGLVHRDLKPGNIFYENGYVKVGDYGLAKAISASHHSGHTITVGTVHYMAPEIGAGSYNRSIDIYALGVLLYEMLTGDVPFDGSSPAEILMKHMTATPEFGRIEEPFARVIKKALAKDPSDRYQTVQEMVEDLFGSENIRDSVSGFSPDELSVVAERVAAKANIVEQPRAERPRAEVAAEPTREVGKQLTDTAQRFAQQADAMGQKVADRVDAEAGELFGSKVHIPGITDPVDPRQRRTLAFLTTVFIAVGAGLLYGHGSSGIVPRAISVFVMIAVCSKTILFSHRRWFVNLEPESRWIPRVVTCALAALLTSMVAEFVGMVGHFSGIGGMSPQGMQLWLSLAIPMILVDWRRISSPQRSKRLSLGSAVWIGLLGAISAEILGQDAVMIASVLAGTSLVLQAYSTFGGAAQYRQATEKRAKIASQQERKETQPDSGRITGRPVPPFVRVLWLAGFFMTLGIGLFLVIWAGAALRGNHFPIGLSFGVDSLILSLFCFIGACRGRFNGWYRYIIKPGILLICVLTVVASSICMACLNADDALFLFLLMMIILPAVAFFILAILPASLFVGSVSKPVGLSAAPSKQPAISSAETSAGVSSFKRLWALILSAGSLFGISGLQRFYVGKIGTGILWFLTGGLFGIGQLIDVIMIIVGQFKDCYGLPLVIWHDSEELKGITLTPQAADRVQTPGRDVAAAIDQRAEAVQAPATEDSPAKSAPAAPTTTVVYEPFHPLAFLFSGIGFILTFAAIVAGSAVGLHIPHFVAAGWPNTQLSAQMEQFFGYPDWPELVMRLGTIMVVILLLLAGIFTVIGRRHLGARHMIRAVLGLIAFFCVLLVFSDAMSGSYFQEVVNLLNSQQIGPAFDKLLISTQNEKAASAGVLFLLSVVVMAWPAHSRQVILTPSPFQGVIL
ncbi:MAG: protein kinase domain-containing protein, partial [Planctomycetota bacterium]